jgi:replicative DNA helicase
LCRLAGVSVSQAAKGLIQPSVLGEAARTFQARGKTLYYVAGNGATTLESIRGTVESIIRRHPEAAHPVVIIDYLQQLARAAAGGGRGEDLFSMISRISGQLSSLAQSTQAHIWAISSMNRAGYANGAKGGLASGKGSGDIEFDAAHVLTLNADEKNQPPDSNTDRLALSLVKNRYGAMGNISLGRDRTTLRIAQIDTRGPNLSSSMGDRVRSNGGR